MKTKRKSGKVFNLVLLRLMLIAALSLICLFCIELCETDLIISADAAEIIDSGTCGENLTWTLDSEGTLTVSGTGDMYSSPGDLYRHNIRTVIIDSGVTSIDDYAFYNYGYLERVVISNSVTNIGKGAFGGCWSLTNITLPSNITTINEGTFNDCNKLTSIVIPDGVTTIGAFAFTDCDSLTDVTIPDSVTNIGKGAFGACWSLTNITLPSNITTINERTFGNCNKLTSIAIPDGVTTIGANAFGGCSSLTSVTIPDSVTTILDYAFSDCDLLDSLYFPDSVTKIGQGLFGIPEERKCLVCGDETSSINPGNDCVLYVGNHLIYAGSATGDFKIKEGTKTIADGAFAHNHNITSVTIPSSVTHIGANAFASCTSLADVYISDLSAWCNIDFDYGLPLSDIDELYALENTPNRQANPLYYADNFNLNGETVTDLIIPDTVTQIKPFAFYGGDSFLSVTIPDSVSYIGFGAFADCTSLAAVYITDLAAWCNIDFDYQFDKTQGFVYTDLICGCFQANPLYYAGNLYTNGKLIKDLVIPGNVREVGGMAFAFCSSIETITIPKSLRAILMFGVFNCDSLTTVYCEGSVDDVLNMDYIGITEDDLEKLTVYFNCCMSYADRVHKYDTKIITPATHLTEGMMDCTCICGDTYTEIIAKLEKHEHSAIVTAPTCTDQGYTTYTCPCGDSYVADYTDKLDHAYVGEITTPSTHLTEGVETFTCTACGDAYTEPVAKDEKHEHSTVITAPTCTEQGYTTYTCPCGDSYVSDYTDKIDHAYASEIIIPATHLTEGVETFTCTACGDTYIKVIAKLEKHEYSADVTAPTCTAKGYTTYTCLCGDTYVADYTNAKGHTEQVIEAVAPTCEKNGLTEGKKCSVCGEVLVAQKEISKFEHTDSDMDNNCDDCGAKVRTCDCICHKTDFFNRFIYKILRFFRNLFGIYSECACGIVHE